MNRVLRVQKVEERCKLSHVTGGKNPADISTKICQRDDFGRWLTDPDFLLRSEIEFKSCDAGVKLSVAEKNMMESQGKV